VGNDCGRALVARRVARMRPLVKARPRWARTRAKGRGQVGPGRGLVGTSTDSRRGRMGPGADSSCVRKCGRKRRLMGVGGWDRARTSHAHRVAGTNIVSSRGRKANRAQPLQ
jgi:hypothetical protein